MTEEVVFSTARERLTAHIKCEIDHHTARRMRERIDARLMEMRPRALVRDFTEVKFMDSSGLGLILGRCERASEIDCSVRIQGLSDSLVRLVKLCGLERIRNLILVS